MATQFILKCPFCGQTISGDTPLEAELKLQEHIRKEHTRKFEG